MLTSFQTLAHRALPSMFTSPTCPITSDSTSTSSKLNIAIAGLAIETSTFTPSRTLAPAFHPLRGPEIIGKKYSSFLGPNTPLSTDVSWHGALIGHALPGGIVTKSAFEGLASEIVRRLAGIVSQNKLDGLWFDIHGAMVVEGMDDAELVLLRRIRQVIGPAVLVSASMDLHGNVSRELCHEVDLITCYRTAPHVDVLETRERACRNLVNTLRQQQKQQRDDGRGESEMRKGENMKMRRPIKAWIPLPILLPGEQTSTRVQPAKELYEAVPGVEAMEGILDAAVWVGYAWADEPRDCAVVVVTGWGEGQVKKGAEKLARLFWKVHEEFTFVAPTGTYKECIDAAIVSENKPFFISDSGDNPTAGGSGDVTWGLTRLLERSEFKTANGPTVIYASVPGPKAVHEAVKAGIGAIVTVTTGAEVDNIHAGPVRMTGRVHAIKTGDIHARIEVVLQVGSVFAILTELRKPYHLEKDFTELNLEPRKADIVIVKIGYLEPQLYDMAKDWMLALTPGGVDQDLKRLGHRRIQRPMWPFDKTFETAPDLRAQIIPASTDPL